MLRWPREGRGASTHVPIVSAVIVTFNSASDILACLDSLKAASSRFSVEVIVVDNASRDETLHVIAHFTTSARVIANTVNVGFAAAANQGIGHCKGDFVLLLNPDARLERESLSRLLDALRAVPEAAAAGPRLLNVDGSRQISARPRPTLMSTSMESLLLDSFFPRSRWLCADPPRDEPAAVECLSGACLLVRRSVLESLGGLDERFFLYSEDIDFCVRARDAGHKLLIVPRARVVHKRGASAFQNRKDFVLQINRAKLKYVMKHFRASERRVATLLWLSGLMFRAAVHATQGLVRTRRDRLQEARFETAALLKLLPETLKPASSPLPPR